MKETGSVIVSWEFSKVDSEDQDILLVGEQENGKISILNAVKGPEARKILRGILHQNKGD